MTARADARSRHARIWTSVAALVLCACALDADAASRFDPALRFRVLHTPHFVIHFHQREDRLARRLAVIAEETWHTLEQPFDIAPPPRTQVVLADQTEFANGYATPLPYDTIVLYTAWPSAAEYRFEDWLRLVFVHEFTHIVHLDRSEGWARLARRMFGRTPIAFPNVFLPPWQIEGLATYEESALTGEGRLHAGDFRAIVGEAAGARSLEPLDRVNGGLTDWPGGAAAYTYGVGFHEYLVDRFGPESLAALARATARRVPYFTSSAFRTVYGRSLGDLWNDYQASLTSAPATQPLDAGWTRVTHQGFTVSAPRFDRFGCAGCPPEVLYSAANPNGFPELARVALDGSPPQRVTTRYLGATTAIGRDTIYFDQVEQRRNVAAFSDLYALSRADGRVRRLTHDARLRDPDLSPDGRTLVATQARAGQRDLVTVSTGEPTAVVPLVSEPDVYFDAPRWSPDGRTVAVERHRLDAMSEIALVDVVTRSVRVVSSDPHTRFVHPTWRPDGAALVVSAAHEEDTFNLFELPLDGSPARQLTHTSGSAQWPEVSPDGRAIVFVGYTVNGYDLFTMPYPKSGEPERRAAPPRVAQPSRPVAAPTPGGPFPVAGYNPLPTLPPTSWSPIIETTSEQTRGGAAVTGFDVLGYHAYAAAATWLLAGPGNATTPPMAEPDWQLYYAYDRWRPTFYVAASSATSFFAGVASDVGTATDATRRERTLEGGVILPIRHTRASHAALLSVARSADDYTLPTGSFTRDRTPLRAAWQTLTAHTYGYSISREDGLFGGATAEVVRAALGSSADATTITADGRAYVPGLRPHHVVALRVSGGISDGDPTVGRTFLLGGASSDLGAADFSSRASSLLRGFPDATFAGARVALVNAEYRWPIARPQRGIGTWPVFLHTVHAAIFADAGDAWTRAASADTLKTSAGGEVSANIVAGYFAPITLTIGAAWGHDRSGAAADRATVYFRVGKAF